ncbi:hypothetical protein HJC23_005888 [Cyclotella cryptica]|uniref:FAD/NAD(P)-binding domain-containing protein n=1 Tax=Cyclotella cryptica TaxID=29204 RepID=A0ABD3QZ44_9STRA|eukprot:CCRYP_000425-RA/>CCRYP_000425-RA protein AED:0.04 eAED:0.03 QI:0/-1/0/1/-1/1/1/0/924
MSPIHGLLSRVKPSAAVIAAAHVSVLLVSRNEFHSKDREDFIQTTDHPNSGFDRILHNEKLPDSQYNFRKSADTVDSSTSNPQPLILASSPANSNHDLILDECDTQKGNALECDYVIIGHGHAGQSALLTLKTLEPNADIVIIDPNIHPKHAEGPVSGAKGKKQKRSAGTIQNLPTRATFIQHAQKIVQVAPLVSFSSVAQTRAVHYRKSVLLATGSRGAPPPDECVSVDSRSRILELRSTTAPPFQNHKSNNPTRVIESDSINNAGPERNELHLPILDPATVRSLSLMASSQGATIAVMGSGFEALELAASLARVSPRTHNNSDKEDEKKILLLFGSAGPLSSRLPRYLSAAVSKRLRQCGIDVEERSLTRYISMNTHQSKDEDRPSASIPRLEIYTVKSYDRLDSRRIEADLLVLAPSVGGLHGTAVLPTSNDTTTKVSNDYQPWSSLVSPPLLTCYLEDGRIATNSEFLGASSIYAAGSVAKYPNGRTGKADVAGGDHMSAHLSGEVAARNMVMESFAGDRGKSDSWTNYTTNHIQETIPVWRSDKVPYLPSLHQNNVNNQADTLALYSMGIHALCVGKCDSTTMATHGFWWTNTNHQSNESKNTEDVDNSITRIPETKFRPNAFMRRLTRKAINLMPKGSFVRGGSLPVYGSGVVFYLDQCGSIQGVMLWGLPFTQDAGNVQSELNVSLVERMKDMIRTNGGIAIHDHSERIAKESYGVNIDVDLLSYLHLSEESKYLATMALTGSEETNGNNVTPKIMLSRPLHRYQFGKHMEMANLGKVRRKDDMGQFTGSNDLFYSSQTMPYLQLNPIKRIEEPSRPPSLKRMYTIHGETVAGEHSDVRLRQERSRPPKEDPLWLRQDEERRFVNKKEAAADSFIRNMLLGQFSDGSEAVQQAPVPQLYLDAKERLRSWTEEEAEEE